jgi:hypothetical protein
MKNVSVFGGENKGMGLASAVKKERNAVAGQISMRDGSERKVVQGR